MRLEKSQLILLLHSIQFSSNLDTIYWHLDKQELNLYILFTNSSTLEVFMFL
jgi:hypothetical protein